MINMNYLDTLEKRRRFLMSKRNKIVDSSWRMWFCQRRLKRLHKLLEDIDYKIYVKDQNSSHNFLKRFIESQVELDPDFEKILRDNYWDLLV